MFCNHLFLLVIVQMFGFVTLNESYVCYPSAQEVLPGCVER
jgi:hypothetical protein